MENTSQGLVPFALPYTPAKHIKTIAVSTTYFNLSNQFAHSSEIRSGFFLIFLKMYRYKACTTSPNVPNAQANPQKNLPNNIVYKQIRISTVTKDVNSIRPPAPICVNMYFTPANAAVYTEGMKIKYRS